jgi:hypothetical protein
MIVNEEAAWEIHQVLSERNIPYAIIGGIAVQYWGEARNTKDLDLTVFIPAEEQEEALRWLIERLSPRREDSIELARNHRIYLTQTSDGFPVDISLGLPGYEEQMIERAVNYRTQTGKLVCMCSAEDLIIHKLIAGRPQDIRDVEGIIIRQAALLDRSYIRSWLTIFAGWLESNDVINRFEQAWRQYGPES